MGGKEKAGSGVDSIEKKKAKCPVLACCKVPLTTQQLRYQRTQALRSLVYIAIAWGKLALVATRPDSPPPSPVALAGCIECL